MPSTRSAAPLDRGLSIVEASTVAGIPPGSLRARIAAGIGPRILRIGRRVVVPESSLHEWLAEGPEPLTREIASRARRVAQGA